MNYSIHTTSTQDKAAEQTDLAGRIMIMRFAKRFS